MFKRTLTRTNGTYTSADLLTDKISNSIHCNRCEFPNYLGDASRGSLYVRERYPEALRTWVSKRYNPGLVLGTVQLRAECCQLKIFKFHTQHMAPAYGVYIKRDSRTLCRFTAYKTAPARYNIELIRKDSLSSVYMQYFVHNTSCLHVKKNI